MRVVSYCSLFLGSPGTTVNSPRILNIMLGGDLNDVLNSCLYLNFFILNYFPALLFNLAFGRPEFSSRWTKIFILNLRCREYLVSYTSIKNAYLHRIRGPWIKSSISVGPDPLTDPQILLDGKKAAGGWWNLMMKIIVLPVPWSE